MNSHTESPDRRSRPQRDRDREGPGGYGTPPPWAERRRPEAAQGRRPEALEGRAARTEPERPPTVCPILTAAIANPVPCQGCPCSWYLVTEGACAIPIIALALTSATGELHPPAAPPTPPGPPPRPDSPQQPACRVCGCTQDDACMTAEGPCHWVEPDLCSACAGAARRSRPQRDPHGGNPPGDPAGAPAAVEAGSGPALYLPVNELLIPGRPQPGQLLTDGPEAPYGP